MSSYRPLSTPLREPEDAGQLPELEAPETAENAWLAGHSTGREVVEMIDSEESSAVSFKVKVLRLIRPPALLLAAAALVLTLSAMGRTSQAQQPQQAGQHSRADATVLLAQEADPCDPLVGQSGKLRAMNPCRAPIDSMGSPGSMGEIKKELGQDVAELLSMLKVPEKVEASPWKVVAPGWVKVFAEKNTLSKVKHGEPHCSTIIGIREGGWLKLTENRGYMQILHDGKVLMEPNKEIFTRITNGTCADNFMFPVLNPEECQAAAEKLHLFDTSVNVDEPGEIPPGCYLTIAGKLRLAPSGVNESYGQIAASWRTYLNKSTSSQQVFEVICASQDKAMDTCNPLLNTTSTTTITATTTLAETTTKLWNMTRVPGWKPSLFCFSVTRAVGYEPGLVLAQYAKGASIFGCDEYKVYSNGGIVNFGDFNSIPIKAPASVMGDVTKPGVTTSSFLNTVIFQRVWDAVIKEGNFWHHDWIVKVDPDAVFFPERLHYHVDKFTPADFMKGQAMYFPNCDLTYGPMDSMKFGKLFGSIEIYSRTAIGAYANGGEAKCKGMAWQGWGEDFYMQKCMELLGVTHQGDFTLVSDKRCHPSSCADRTKVVFHDFKDIPSYFDCWGQSLGATGVAAYLEKAKGRKQRK